MVFAGEFEDAGFLGGLFSAPEVAGFDEDAAGETVGPVVAAVLAVGAHDVDLVVGDRVTAGGGVHRCLLVPGCGNGRYLLIRGSPHTAGGDTSSTIASITTG